jgi:hypothetical protein
MKKLLLMMVVLSSPALAQDVTVKEPVCEPIGRTSKGDLVYSMQCRNIPGLPAGNGYNPAPTIPPSDTEKPPQAKQ